MRRHAARLTSAVVLASTLGLIPAANADSAPLVPAPVPVAQQRADVLSQLNAERARTGQGPLVAHPMIQASAQHWADVVAATDGGGHDPDRDRVLVQEGGCRLSSEVVTGAGHSDESAPPAGAFAVQNWLNSPAHRSAILSSLFDQAGVGVSHYSVDISEMMGRPATMEMTAVVVQLAADCPAGAPKPPVVTPPVATPTPPNQVAPVVTRKTRTVRR